MRLSSDLLDQIAGVLASVAPAGVDGLPADTPPVFVVENLSISGGFADLSSGGKTNLIQITATGETPEQGLWMMDQALPLVEKTGAGWGLEILEWAVRIDPPEPDGVTSYVGRIRIWGEV